MFKNLTNFGYQRTKKEAFGFYLAYFLFFLFVALLLSAVAAVVLRPEDPTNLGSKIGIFIGVLAPLVLSYLILSAKKQLGNIKLLFVGILSGILGILGGALLGLIPVAFLTTVAAAGEEGKII